MKVMVLSNNVIPNFTPELKKSITALAIKYVEKRYSNDINAIEKLNDEFEALGFVWLVTRHRGLSITKFLFHEKKKLIIKFDPSLEAKKPRKSCPTYMIKFPIYDRGGMAVVIVQPMLDMISHKAKKLISAHYKIWKRTCGSDTISGFSVDAHDENVGLYRGKLVQFDW